MFGSDEAFHAVIVLGKKRLIHQTSLIVGLQAQIAGGTANFSIIFFLNPLTPGALQKICFWTFWWFSAKLQRSPILMGNKRKPMS